ncbi:hypothetical protein Tco_1347981 [Tanacetum coccineum]
MYEKVKRENERFILIGSAEDDKLIEKMNKKAAGRRLKMKAPKRSKRQKTDSDHEEENQLIIFLKIVPEEEEKIDYEILGTRLMSLEAKMEVRRNFECWFQNHTTNGHQLSIHLVVYNEELAIPEQTATDKGISNPLMDGSLPKTTKTDLKNRSVWIHPPGLQDVYT